MNLPRIMITATSSGSGKTLITCGLLQAFVNRGFSLASFKCGPDYIDPMFHSKIIGTKSKNLDTFFCEEGTIKYLFGKTAKEVDLSIMEGVMGYYDGLGGVSTHASSYELAEITDTPVVLVVNCSGMSLSVLPIIQGFHQYKKDSHIVGVILNQMPKNIYFEMKEHIENQCGIKVLGYVPFVKDIVIESRHLGLVKPEEIFEFHTKLNRLANIFEETIELDEILEIARNTKEMSYEVPKISRVEGEPLIAVAKDEAFCFYYQDNLELLKDMGAKIIEFSPLNDGALPEKIHGLILGGGYPELVAEKLSENVSMRESIKNELLKGIPCMAECGGFMYLHSSMEDICGNSYPMVGIIDGKVHKTSGLKRFGYIKLEANHNQMIADYGESICAHEFHHFESSICGDSFTAHKPLKETQYNCIHGNEHLAAGFPHLYYYSNTNMPYKFLKSCLERKKI